MITKPCGYIRNLKNLPSGGSRISRRGGVDLVGGGVDSRGGYVSKILYVETKESGPVGGGRAPGTPPRSANAAYYDQCNLNFMLSLTSLLNFQEEEWL